MEYTENLKKIIEVKKYLDESLYQGHSLVTYDLVLRILESNLTDKPTTIKEVCTQSTQSMLNTRKHLNHLISDGWVELAQDTKDKRQRLLKPTDKLKILINELGKNFFKMQTLNA
jgi:DNA-binding MarR family transcriptional regulator